MADLYDVTAGDTAVAADVNQYKTALEGGSEQQYALVQKSGANFTVKMATSNGTDKVSFQDSGGNEVASINSDGDIVGIMEPTTFTFPTATSPSETTDGQAIWDSDGNYLTVGDGAGTVVMKPVTSAYSTADTTKNANTTLGDITGLGVAVLASERYVITGRLYVTSGASGGIKVAFTVPTSAAIEGTVKFLTASGVAVAYSSDLTSASGSTAAVIAVDIDATLTMSTTAGTLQLQMAQNVNDGTDTTVYNNSTLVATRL